MKRPVIVCIDDEPDVLNSLKIELKKAIGDECIIETAQGGEDALDLLTDLQAGDYEIALVVSDYIMPDIKGDELLQIIHERSPNTLKIMLTGQADLDAVGHAIKYAKLYRYIPKPWQNEDLKLTVVEAVHSYLQDQKLADEVIKGREANQQLKLANEALSASESRLNQFLAALPVGVSVYNPDGSIAYINHAAHQLLDADSGLADSMPNTAEQLVASYQFYNAEKDRLYFPENFPILRALQGEYVKVNEVEISQYGLTITLEISVRPIFDRHGNIVFAIAVIQDISQRKELEKFLANYQRTLEADIVERTEQLQKAAFAAEAANRAKSTFLANMSHELRTPLNAILGFTQIIESSPNLTPEDRENIRIIYRSGEHLLTLINQALDLAKIEAGRMTLFPTSFDLYDLLDELEDMFQLRAKNQGLQLVFQRVSDIPQYVRSDEVKLRQVLINLLSNAMKFTQIGGVSVKVRRKAEVCSAEDLITNVREKREEKEGEIISSSKNLTNSEFRASNSPGNPNISSQFEGELLAKMDRLNISSSLFLEFEIEDTGVGIAPEELGNLFQAFVQTESGQKSQQGTGLGLTISRQFVRLMGGDLTVESQLKRGTIFRFEIQVSAVDAIAIAAPKISREVIGLEPDGPCYRILIVDDREDNRQLLVKMLSPLGFVLQEASNGIEAVKIWESWQPHLILMDLQMPVMDGYEATIEIKAKIQQREEEQQGNLEMDIPNPEFPIPKIIALTASTLEERRSFALLVGCDDFIRKPFRKTDIFDTLHKHLGLSYIHADLTGSDSMVDRNKLSNSSNAVLAHLPKLPAEWVDNMRQVIRSADFDLIGRTIEKLSDGHPEFAKILQGHLDNFDYQNILNLIAESQKLNSTGEG
jgi:signal transduction histidine kinase/response regulator RpfG family c-di-GMP phosphodiesterase